MNPSPVLKRIEDASCCTGCGLCASLAPDAITMKMKTTGFLRPEQTADVSALADAQIQQHCPGISIAANSDEAVNHVIWGPIVASRTGFATDVRLRKHASSGGVISALASYLIESKLVDFVLQVSASETSPLDNQTSRSFDVASVFNAAGSRYAPSAPLMDLYKHLAGPGQFAVVGKPCDIAALRSLARTDDRIDKKIPLMLSFFCAGIPGRNASVKIVNTLGFQEDELKNFRYRGDGWPGFATAQTTDGREARMSYNDSWGNILSKQVQFRCKICPDGSGGQADIVCGDAWESDEKGYPLFAETDGRSLVLSRTNRGEQFLQRAITNGVVSCQDLAIDQIAKMQPFQAKRKRQVISRLAAMRIAGFKPPRYTGMQLARAALRAGVAENIRGFWGTLRRLPKKPDRRS
jgi:coenzyme F420 hydrogenase subunit beta